jgi:PilZ domain.
MEVDHAASKDKRQYARLPRPYRVQARELVFPIARHPVIDSGAADISKGGICIESRSPLPEGTRLHLSVHVPLLNKFRSGFFKVYENDAEQTFEAIGEVTWARPQSGVFLMGVKFLDADESSVEALGKLIDKAMEEIGE